MTAIFHLDGSVVMNSLRIENTDPHSHLYFKVKSNMQEYAVWAFDRLAVVVFSYVHVAHQGTGDLSDRLQVSVKGVPISGKSDYTILLARSMTWHTSSSVRRVAEQLIVNILNGQVGDNIYQETKRLNGAPPREVRREAQKSRKRKSR